MPARVSRPIFMGATWVFALLVGAAIGTAITSAIVGRQSTEEVPSDFNTRISAAREEARTALEKATNEANIAIAAARTETEEAVAEAAKARADAGNAVAEAAKVRAEEKKAVAEAVRANERAAELEREAAQARTEKEELKATLGWRALPPAVVAQLTEALAAKPSKVTIQYTNGDTEALYFALQMSNIFATANWQATMLGVTVQGTIIFGIFVPDSPSPSTTVIRDALSSANVVFVTIELPPRAIESHGDTIDNAALLFVGSKPLPR
jgi:hypothetical protein